MSADRPLAQGQMSQPDTRPADARTSGFDRVPLGPVDGDRRHVPTPRVRAILQVAHQIDSKAQARIRGSRE
jgi:hypothetical protein